MAFKGLRFAGGEIRNASAGTIMKVVMVAISIIPLLYGGLYLTAFLNPYENLDTVPVAVVNEDAGAEVDGEWRVVGNDVAEKLADNHDGLGWQFVSANEAKSGLESGRYYMTCTIPENFTETIASAESDTPEKAALLINYNETQNMLASQIGGSVWKEVRTQVSDSVAEEYWNTVFDRINDGGGQIKTAADGAEELSDGLIDARKGSETITTNLGSLADGSNSLVDGLQQLVSGTAKLHDGTGTLSKGANTLADGTGDLSDGADKLASGTAKLKKEGTQALANGTAQLADQTSALPDDATVKKAEQGAEAISNGFDGLKGGLASLKGDAASGTGLAYAAYGSGQLASGLSSATASGGAISQLSGGVSALQSGTAEVEGALTSATNLLNGIDKSSLSAADQQKLAGALQYVQGANNGLTTKVDPGLATMSSGISNLKTSLTTAADSASQISTGLNAAVAAIGSSSDTSTSTLNGAVNNLSSGYNTFSSQVMPLIEGAPKLKSAISQIDAGAKTVNTQMAKVASGASSLSSGANKVNKGAASLADGASQLNDGVATLADGTSTAEAGSEKIADGATRLRDGSQELTDGLTTAEDGAGELADGLADGASELHVDDTSAKAEVMSAPVKLDEEYFTTVKNYGTGFAPYFISLGLWVGALMAGFVLKPLNRRLVLSGGNPVMVAFSSFMPLALVSIVQALLLLVVLQFGLNLQIDNVPGYYAFGILTALAFAAFMQFLMVTFGFPGKFIAIILLMLQLTSAAGTFPIEQTPTFFQMMNPFMPMTYVVAGMRQIMTGVDYNTVALCVAVLLGIALVSFGLTALVARSKRLVLMEDLHPLLQLG